MDAYIKNVRKYKKIDKGGQGTVYKIPNKNLVIKEFVLDEEEWDNFDDPSSQQALKKSLFIEQKSNEMINTIREICPHFAEHKRSYYDKKRKKAWHINEYIEKSITLYEWCQQEHEQEVWENIYTQIIYTLYSLKVHFNMIHLDLHAHNVLIQKLKKEEKWNYKIDDETYTLKSKGYKIYIIDFGHAWIPGELRSWFIRERYRPCRVHTATDITHLYRSYLEFSEAPKGFNKKLRTYIKQIRESGSFTQVLKDLLNG
jgi:serine/threonine protein kinase